ncbi:MAG: asparagine synthase-related protein [Gammaproteobacteria bacterium]
MRAQARPGWSEQVGSNHWLVAQREQLVSDATRAAAVEGFLTEAEIGRSDPARAILEPTNREAGAPSRHGFDGHYSLARICQHERSLSLERGLSGGERLYYAELGDLVLFASSVRPLLVHPEIGRNVNLERVPEVLLTGLTLFGSGTLLAGIEEVLPGRAMTWTARECFDTALARRLLNPPAGDPGELALTLRDQLGDAIVASVGRSRPVAVSLSGGIDSSAVAALAVEAFGADNVVAFTYEFADPTHRSETAFAAEVCQRLGIHRHVVFPIGFEAFLAAIPETVWRAESFVHWPKAFMLCVARFIRERGFDRFLSGFGIGSHMAYFTDLGWLVESAGLGRYLPALWRHGRSRAWLHRLGSLHPGLEQPSWRLLLPLLSMLHARRLISEPCAYYPAEMRPLVERVPEFGHTAAEARLLDRALGPALGELALDRLFSCIDITRWEKPMREVGALRLSPAHYPSTLPYAYLPLEPQPFVWSQDRGLRPGKLLTRRATAGLVPDSVLYRRKLWSDAVISPAWMRAGIRWMQRTLTQDPLLALGEDCARAAAIWDPRSPQSTVTAFRFWHRIFIEQAPGTGSPTWRSLTCEHRAGQRP